MLEMFKKKAELISTSGQKQESTTIPPQPVNNPALQPVAQPANRPVPQSELSPPISLPELAKDIFGRMQDILKSLMYHVRNLMRILYRGN